MTDGRGSTGAAIHGSRTRCTVSAGLAISGAIVVAVATFLPWYRWSFGGLKLTRFGPNLYELGSSSGAGWNPIASVFVDIGAAVLLLSGLLVLLGRDHLARLAPAGMSIGVLVVIVSSVMVQSPHINGFHSFAGDIQPLLLQRGPGLFVALAGTALGVAALVVLVVTPRLRAIHNVEPSAGVRAPLLS